MDAWKQVIGLKFPITDASSEDNKIVGYKLIDNIYYLENYAMVGIHLEKAPNDTLIGVGYGYLDTLLAMQEQFK